MASNQSRFRAAQFAVRGMMVRGLTCATVLILASAASFVRAQIVPPEPADLSGSWQSAVTDDPLEVVEGPFTDDWTGMPLNAAGRALAQSYSASMQSEQEHVCQAYGQFHYATGLVGGRLRISPLQGGPTDQIQAWKLEKVTDIGGMTIWMDGRPQPSKYADHSSGAFTTGYWKGNTLIAHTTGMKRAFARDNGAFYSDEATMTTTFIPHGDSLVIIYILNDPVYFTQPYIYSRYYVRSAAPVSTAWPPCIVNYEGLAEGEVPFFLPGKDPLLDQMMRVFHVPESASEGGADTMYPAYRNRLKAQYLKLYPTFPKRCTQYCTIFRNGRLVANEALPEETVPAESGRPKAKSVP